jgi:hypothetical protein
MTRLVGFSNIFVDTATKFIRTIGVGTNIELAFIDEKGRGIAVLQFALAHVISAEASILRNISGRILAKRDLVGHGNEIVDRNPEPGLNCRLTFDGLVTGKIGNWVVSVQNYAVAVNVHLAFAAAWWFLRPGRRSPLSLAFLLGFQDRLAALITGTVIAMMRPERNETGCVHNLIVFLSSLEQKDYP